jgi:uncharacterized protein YodC (DUF2158 family)
MSDKIQIDDGGPAFPIPAIQHSRNADWQTEYGHDGMTLRDWFAGQIAPAIWKQFNDDGTATEFPDWKTGVAIEAYRMADAMLAARKGGHS